MEHCSPAAAEADASLETGFVCTAPWLIKHEPDKVLPPSYVRECWCCTCCGKADKEAATKAPVLNPVPTHCKQAVLSCTDLPGAETTQQRSLQEQPEPQR
mmetsp:Transcript_24089/g.56034  ORF Transcript_24089/g.56034 Transcript_24089/m.56034 type:complete len:100 (+) Transcript_24089:50-349(+)